MSHTWWYCPIRLRNNSPHIYFSISIHSISPSNQRNGVGDGEKWMEPEKGCVGSVNAHIFEPDGLTTQNLFNFFLFSVWVHQKFKDMNVESPRWWIRPFFYKYVGRRMSMAWFHLGLLFKEGLHIGVYACGRIKKELTNFP